jgi:putative transposase
LIKGESAFWANKNNLLKTKFEWADEYYAASVSDSSVEKVRKYIYNQEEHHRKVSFEEEYKKIESLLNPRLQPGV